MREWLTRLLCRHKSQTSVTERKMCGYVLFGPAIRDGELCMEIFATVGDMTVTSCQDCGKELQIDVTNKQSIEKVLK